MKFYRYRGVVLCILLASGCGKQDKTDLTEPSGTGSPQQVQAPTQTPSSQPGGTSLPVSSATVPTPRSSPPDNTSSAITASKTAILNSQLVYQDTTGGEPTSKAPELAYAKAWLAYFEDQVSHQRKETSDGADLMEEAFEVSAGLGPWYVDMIISPEAGVPYYHGKYAAVNKNGQYVIDAKGEYFPFGFYSAFERDSQVSGDNVLLEYFSFTYDDYNKEVISVGKGALFHNPTKTSDSKILGGNLLINAVMIQDIQASTVSIQLAAGLQRYGQDPMPPSVGQGPYNILMCVIDGVQFGSQGKAKLFLKRLMASSTP